jgi:glycosyltransferase involved in cell wall biosynthesis
MRRVLLYAVVTPVRNERSRLPALRECVAKQTTPPAEWLIVDDGSTDGTVALAESIADEHPWARVVQLETTGPPERGRAVVRSFMEGVNALASVPDVIIKMDADVTFGDDYVERLLARFRDALSRVGCDTGVPPRMPRARNTAGGARGLGRLGRPESSPPRMADRRHR